jgi:hypothetical protein
MDHVDHRSWDPYKGVDNLIDAHFRVASAILPTAGSVGLRVWAKEPAATKCVSEGRSHLERLVTATGSFAPRGALAHSSFRMTAPREKAKILQSVLFRRSAKE